MERKPPRYSKLPGQLFTVNAKESCVGHDMAVDLQYVVHVYASVSTKRPSENSRRGDEKSFRQSMTTTVRLDLRYSKSPILLVVLNIHIYCSLTHSRQQKANQHKRFRFIFIFGRQAAVVYRNHNAPPLLPTKSSFNANLDRTIIPEKSVNRVEMATAKQRQLSVPDYIDEAAQLVPNDIWAIVPRSTLSLDEGWYHYTFADLAKAVDGLARWIENCLGVAEIQGQTIGYMG